MRGVICELNLYNETRKPYGFIYGNDGNKYYFNQQSMIGKVLISDFFVEDEVSFSVEKTPSGYDRANHMKLEHRLAEMPIAKFETPGISKRLNLDDYASKFNLESQEIDVIKKLSEVFWITRVGQHSMDQSSTYEFCLASVTEYLKQFVRESGEFIIVFSYFSNQRWQEKTLKVEREIRKRSEIIDRRPLANFYILVSNAAELRVKVDSVKGLPKAAVIPFSFEELLACQGKNALVECIIDRFAEYYFENDMLAENDAIDDDNLLFGDRGKIADSIVSKCEAGKNSGIFGLRRSGKTSVLNAVLRRLARDQVPYIKLEARNYESYESWKDVLFDIACEVKACTMGVVRGLDEDRRSFVKRLNMRNQEDDYDRRPVRCFTEDISACLHEINKGREEETQFVIAIDEIELIAYNSATSDTWKTKESCKGFWSAMRDCGCSLVLCGVNASLNEKSTLRYQDEELDNPMYGRITDASTSPESYLPSFTDEQTKLMINTLGGYSNLDFSDVYVQINDAFGGQPWSIRQFCSYVFKSIRGERRADRLYRISRATCSNLLRRYNNSSDGIQMCETILQYLNKLYPSEYQLLGKLAVNPDAHSIVMTDEIISIDHLKKYGLIEHDSGTGDISFRIGIIRDYMNRVLSKDPNEMTNDERRRYVQDRVALCEKKLKTLIRDAYLAPGGKGEAAGLTMIRQYVNVDQYGKKRFIRFKCQPLVPKGIDPYNCDFSDYFDHKKFTFYFSTLSTMITESCWNLLKAKFEKVKMRKENFVTYMTNLNAGRTDADHYDAEDISASPEKWEIDNVTLQTFTSAYAQLERFFQVCDLM